jgi:hypothetical protein
MKKMLLFLAFAALLSLGAGRAAFAHNGPHGTKTVTVVMHDPGCHWFSVGGKFVTKLSVTGPVKLANYDEHALLVAGSTGVQKDPVGKSIPLAKGTYKITMVHQAADDNHLTLVVR